MEAVNEFLLYWGAGVSTIVAVYTLYKGMSDRGVLNFKAYVGGELGNSPNPGVTVLAIILTNRGKRPLTVLKVIVKSGPKNKKIWKPMRNQWRNQWGQSKLISLFGRSELFPIHLASFSRLPPLYSQLRLNNVFQQGV